MISAARRAANRALIFGLTTALTTTLGIYAHAQVPDAQNTSGGAGRAETQINQDSFMPSSVPDIQVSEFRVQGAPAGAENINLTLHGITFEGATVYSDAQFEALYADKVGQKITLADVYGIAADVTRKYRDDGYILTQVVIPPQTIEGGHVRMQVVEGFVNSINVESGSENGIDLVRAYANNIATDGSPLNVRDMERSLLLINDLPGIKARSVLSPSANTAGAADLNIIVERDPFEAEVFANNYGTRFLGPFQLGASAVTNSLLGLNERITGQFVVAPDKSDERELVYGALTYQQPVGSYGTVLAVQGSITSTDPGYTLEEFDVEGLAHYVGVTATHPIIRSRRMNWNARATFDLRDVDSANNIEDTRKDRIRAARVGSRFEVLDTIFGAGYNMLDVEIAQGLGILGASDEDNANVSRPGASDDFTKLEAEIQRLQRVTGDINLLLGVRGQWTNEGLLSTEEFGLGGMSYNRGYDPSEVVGDSGFAGKVEVQWAEPLGETFFDTYQLFGFWDVGTVWNYDATNSAQKRESLSSTGLGLRASFATGTSLEFTFAVPINREVQTQEDQDPRFFVGVSHRF